MTSSGQSRLGTQEGSGEVSTAGPPAHQLLIPRGPQPTAGGTVDTDGEAKYKCDGSESLEHLRR